MTACYWQTRLKSTVFPESVASWFSIFKFVTYSLVQTAIVCANSTCTCSIQSHWLVIAVVKLDYQKNARRHLLACAAVVQARGCSENQVEYWNALLLSIWKYCISAAGFRQVSIAGPAQANRVEIALNSVMRKNSRLLELFYTKAKPRSFLQNFVSTPLYWGRDYGSTLFDDQPINKWLLIPIPLRFGRF